MASQEVPSIPSPPVDVDHLPDPDLLRNPSLSASIMNRQAALDDNEPESDSENSENSSQSQEGLSPPPSSIQESSQVHPYQVDGISIQFPYIPYKSQEQMMDKIIAGVKNGENCLLESPTGTGKTAAILCALLAWQKKELEDRELKWNREQTELQQNSTKNQPSTSQGGSLPSPLKRFKGSFDGKPIKIYYATRTHSQVEQVIKQLGKTSYSKTPMVVLGSRAQTCVNPLALNPGNGKKVDELCEKMRNSKIEVDQYNPSLAQNSGSNSAAREVPKCKFYDYTNEKGHLFGKFTRDRSNDCWDIEDLNLYSKDHNCCPYYGIRNNLLPEAQIIFCTYNHLLHQYIRAAFKINVKGSILVFDEAHNIEDVCRSIASRNVSLSKMEKVKFHLDDAALRQDIPSIKVGPLQRLNAAVTQLLSWLDRQKNQLQIPDGKKKAPTLYLNPNEAGESVVVRTFSEFGFGPNHIGSLWMDFCTLQDQNQNHEENDREEAKFKIESSAAKLISSFLYCLNHLFHRNPNHPLELDYLEHYQVCVVKELVWKTIDGVRQEVELLELQLICLNPALTFAPMQEARTVIVTSGSLSPIDSFTAELDAPFQHTMSADHVVGSNRIFSGIVTAANPITPYMIFSWKSLFVDNNFDQYSMLLAEILLDVCGLVKGGILVFVPSKYFLWKFQKKWDDGGILRKFDKKKDIFWEHEATGYEGKDTLRVMLTKYRQTIKEKNKQGAILFAYFRGKISEGVDFPDDEARAVVTVGIPCAPLGSEEVIAKIKYNDNKAMLQQQQQERQQLQQQQQNDDQQQQQQQQQQDQGQAQAAEGKRKVLNGWEWYDTNAVRALNQAVGRCIRHSNDWGAILMCENRLGRPKLPHYGYLSKWVRDSIGSDRRMSKGTMTSLSEYLRTFLEPLQGNPAPPEP